MTKKKRRQSVDAKTEPKKVPKKPAEIQKVEKPKLSKKQLEKLLQTERDRVEKIQTKLAYLQAEYDNYVKSMSKREEQLRQQANHSLILNLLPVLDDLERAQLMVPRIEANEPYIEGLNMVVKNLKTAFKSAGVKHIECEGQPFDPLRHEAVVREETNQYPANTVIEELRKGYLLKGAMLRPAMVKIAIPQKKPSKKKKKTQE